MDTLLDAHGMVYSLPFSGEVRGPIKKEWQEKEIRNSPTPLPESSGPSCPTLEQDFWVRQGQKRHNKRFINQRLKSLQTYRLMSPLDAYSALSFSLTWT